MKNKILITGGTGLIGNFLTSELQKRGYFSIIATRYPERYKNTDSKKYIPWSINKWEDLVPYVEEAGKIIHLAGEPIASKRWTNEQKLKLYNSRIVSTQSLVKAISASEKKPELFLHASAIGYYGFDQTLVADEDSIPGNGFLSDLCEKWEDAAGDAARYGIRRVGIRIGIVLSDKGGALPKLLLPFRFFAGAVPGNGQQIMSWIHIKDLVNLIIYAVEKTDIHGYLNGVSPDSVTMKEFAIAIKNIMKRPFLFNIPEWAIKLILGESAVIVTGGKKVIPKRVESFGYKYDFPDIHSALKDLLSNK